MITPRLSSEEIEAIKEKANRHARNLAADTEGNFKPEDISAIYDDADRAEAMLVQEVKDGIRTD